MKTISLAPCRTKVTRVLFGIILMLSGLNPLFSQIQDCKQYWYLEGNTPLNDDCFLGTTDAHDIRYKTNNSWFGIMTRDGKTGLGIMTPNYKLHLHDDALLSDGGTNTGDGESEQKAISSYGYSAMQITNKNTDVAKTDGLLLYTRDRDAGLNLQEEGYLRFHTSGAIRFSIYPDGKAGFNTTVNQAQVNILAQNNNGLYLLSRGISDYGIFVRTQKNTTDFFRGYNGEVQKALINGEGETQLMSGVNRVSIAKASGLSAHYGTSYIGFNATQTSTGWTTSSDGYTNGGFVVFHDIAGSLLFSPIARTTANGNAGQTITNQAVIDNTTLYLGYNGNVGIGTDNPGNYKLAVEGTICARKVRVTEAPFWSDFVFEADYKLMSLAEVEAYITQNGHLPGIPSASDVKQDGVDLVEMNALLLQKIEELTLYVIELEKKIDNNK